MGAIMSKSFDRDITLPSTGKILSNLRVRGEKEIYSKSSKYKFQKTNRFL
jgi:hypothetical protein